MKDYDFEGERNRAIVEDFGIAPIGTAPFCEATLSALRRAYAAGRTEALNELATPGWWGPFGMGLFADSVGDRNVSRCSYVAQFYTTDVHDRPRTFDIDFVAETHNSWPAIYRELMAARDLFSHCKFTGDETSETHHALIGRVPVVELDLYVAARKENDQ